MLHSKKQMGYQAVINLVMILVTLMVVLPFVLVFISSLTEENVLIRNGYSFFPEKMSIYAYQYIIKQGDKIIRAYLITIIVTLIGTLVNLAMSALIAYPLSVRTLPHRRAITVYVFFTMLFNGGRVPPYLMTSIPEALYEAAEIDGANHFKIFSSIVIPLGKPILVTMGLFSGLAYWNDWTNGLYYLSGNDGQKLYGIQNLLNQMITDIQYLASGKVTGNIGAEVAKLPATSIRMAIAFIAMLPLFIIYPFLQKYFSEGITLGAVKG